MRPVLVMLTSALVVVAPLVACSSAEQPRVEETATATTSRDAGTPHFAVPEGWYALEHLLDVRAEDIPVAWASNVTFKSADLAEPKATGPTETIRTLPSDGIVIVAVGPHAPAGSAPFPRLRFPLELSDGRYLVEQYKGQPAPHVSFGYIDTWVGDERVLNIHYYIGTNDPSAGLLAEADRALATFSLD